MSSPLASLSFTKGRTDLSARRPMDPASAAEYPPLYLGKPEFSASDPYGNVPYNRRIAAENKKGYWLGWVQAKGSLRPTPWPLVNGHRVEPHELLDVHESYDFNLPDCLCPRGSINPEAHQRCAIILAGAKAQPGVRGKWLATCAQGICHYWVKLDDIFSRKRIYCAEVQRRKDLSTAPGEVAFDYEQIIASGPAFPESPVTGTSIKAGSLKRKAPADHDATEASTSAGKKRRVDQVGDVDPFSLNLAFPNPAKPPTPFTRLMYLDDAGLRLVDFMDLVVLCGACEDWVGTRDAVKNHTCRGQVLDLTANNSDEEDE